MHTSFVAKGIISAEDVFKTFEQKLGDKYKVTFEKKSGNAVTRAISGKSEDKVLIAKNAYHRTFVFVNHDTVNNETYFGFDEATVKGWLKLVGRQSGLIGHIIINLSYGKGTQFYQDVVNVIKETYKPEERTINVGLSALWKKQQ